VTPFGLVNLFSVTGSPWWNSPITWWAVFYIIFVGINYIGIKITMRFTVVINILALGILAFFFIPVEGWVHALWQVGVGWAGATFVLVGMRRPAYVDDATAVLRWPPLDGESVRAALAAIRDAG